MSEEKKQEQDRQAFLVDTLQKLLGQDSPTGFTEKVVTVVEGIAQDLGFATRRTNKGNLVVTVPGRETGRKVGLCAHVDTLGLMVRSITADGMLMVTRVGGSAAAHPGRRVCRILAPAKARYTPARYSACHHRSTCRMMRPPAPGTKKTWPYASMRKCKAKRMYWL